MKTLKPLFLFTILCIALNPLFSQKFKYSIPGLDTLEQNFIVSGAASSVLRNGEGEIIVNSSLVSYWLAFHQNGNNSPVLDRLRNTVFNTDISGYYGISQNGKWDIGLQLGYARTRLDNSAKSSMFKVFDKRPTIDEEIDAPFGTQIKLDESFGGVANIGIRFRYKPFNYVPGLLLTGGYSAATIKDQNEQVQLGADRDFIDLGLSYYKGLTNNVFYFFSSSLRSYIPSKVTDQSFFLSSFNFFLIQRTNNQKLTVYPGLSYTLAFKPSIYDSRPFVRTTEFLFAYVGIQYAIDRKFSVFTTMGFPLFVEVINPQQEIVRDSYSIFALGLRARI
jgi:hypothetical protein